jgi:hypothetical protein
VRVRRSRQEAGRSRRGVARRNRQGPVCRNRQGADRNREEARHILAVELHILAVELHTPVALLGAAGHRRNHPVLLVPGGTMAARRGDPRREDLRRRSHRNLEEVRRRRARRPAHRNRLPSDRARQSRRAGSRAVPAVEHHIRHLPGAAHSHLALRRGPENLAEAAPSSQRRDCQLRAAGPVCTQAPPGLARRVTLLRGPACTEPERAVSQPQVNVVRPLRARQARRRAAKTDRSRRAVQRRPSCL